MGRRFLRLLKTDYRGGSNGDDCGCDVWKAHGQTAGNVGSYRTGQTPHEPIIWQYLWRKAKAYLR